MSDFEALKQWIENTGLENILWATDLDLTVLGTHADPSKVRAPEGLEEDFERLDELTGGKFFIITGRELSYVDTVFPNVKFKASAEYHNMVRFEPDEPHTEPNPRPHWDLIDEDLERVLDQYPGMTMRIKPFMRSVHYSHAEALQDADVKAEAIKKIASVLKVHEDETGQTLENIDGGKVFDIAPEGSNKGNAYNDAMYHVLETGADRPVPIYFGDSPGDIPAAIYARANGGIFVQVGDDPRLKQYADFTLDSPEECCDLVKKIANGEGPSNIYKASGPTPTPKL